jgi:hypothetical protein
MVKLKQEKVDLEQEMEMEEENITNRYVNLFSTTIQVNQGYSEHDSVYLLTLSNLGRLQRQVDMLLLSFRQVETRLQAKGLSLAELGVTLPVLDIPGTTLKQILEKKQ